MRGPLNKQAIWNVALFYRIQRIFSKSASYSWKCNVMYKNESHMVICLCNDSCFCYNPNTQLLFHQLLAVDCDFSTAKRNVLKDNVCKSENKTNTHKQNIYINQKLLMHGHWMWEIGSHNMQTIEHKSIFTSNTSCFANKYKDNWSK